MVEVAEVDAHTNGSTSDAHTRGLSKMQVFLFADGIYQPSYHHRQDDEQIVVGHLHVVGVDLECGKDGCEHKSPQILTPISQHQSGYHWWQIGQSPHLPDVTSSNDNKEIGAEGPHDRA